MSERNNVESGQFDATSAATPFGKSKSKAAPAKSTEVTHSTWELWPLCTAVHVYSILASFLRVCALSLWQSLQTIRPDEIHSGFVMVIRVKLRTE